MPLANRKLISCQHSVWFFKALVWRFGLFQLCKVIH